MPEPIFSNCGFFLKLRKITIKGKNKLKNCIKEYGGEITFAINDKCTHVVTDDADVLSPVHLKTIQKKHLPIVDVDFIWDSVKENRLLLPFACETPKILESTPDVKIVSVCEDDSQKTKDCDKNGPSYKSDSIDSSSTDELRSWPNNDKNIPYFPEDFEVAKYDILEKIAARGEYAVVELQCALQHCDYPFRICTRYSVLNGVKNQKRCTPTKTSEEARKAYELCTEDLKKADFELRHDFPREAEHLASTKLQEMLVVEAISCSTLSEEVGVFVELIWAEALGLLNHLLLKPVTSISLNDVSKAEGILLQARKALDEGKSRRELTNVIAEFYKIIPHKSGLDYNVCKKLLSNKQDLCQLIRDMLNVHEINMSSPNLPSLSKYRALGCKVDPLDGNSDEFNKVKQQVVQNNFSESPIEVLQIYNVSRRTETAAFESALGNVQPLLHASSPCNFVGILSRGLLLPKMVVEEHGIQRTDSGNLGCGIYFSNSISTSIKYSQPNKTDGTRLLVICDVALGACLDTYQKDISLTAAPPGYDSVHGIRKAKDNNSAFQDDEFVVYRPSQIKIKYVVKFCLADDEVKEFHPTIQAELEDQVVVPELQSQPEDYDLPCRNILEDMAAGLLDQSGNPIPLKDIHIKGKIIDFVAQVVVFQTYENTSDNPIEAKYVFPLDDTAAVCGFEAFIKGKHIIGEVKEKEKAHLEYREAVIRGDGAYLMDQDAPDIFTVSVGNLPPSTKVLIKITYITELNYGNRSLLFHLPAAVAPWQQDKALNENTQDTIKKVAVKQIGTKAGGFSLEMSVEMPFKINGINSWTHKLEIKKTDCKAVIRTVEDSSLDVSGFAMEVTIGDVYLPRMWVEKHPDQATEACMLVFQPEFTAPYDPSGSCGETVICLDCSNSMAGSEIQQAKQIALCALQSCCSPLSVIKFGTNFEQFPFNPGHGLMDFTSIKEFILSATPSMGNSDFWKALHYLSLLYPKGKRNILLISDGHLQNEGMTLQIVKQNAHHTRIFTCGVGSAANRHMLRSLSQYGAGAFEYFDVKSKYNWERKIQCQATRMASPACSAVSIKWQQFDTNAPELTYAPTQIQSLFDNERLLVYGFISHCTQATLNALIDNQEFQTMVSTTELQKTTGTMLHKLAARAFIRDYEQGILHENEAEHEMKKQHLKSLIIKLSLENSIVTQFTSFVAIEKRDVNEDQGADTLDVSEIVAKEDVDILPYVQYQPADEDSDVENIMAFRCEALCVDEDEDEDDFCRDFRIGARLLPVLSRDEQEYESLGAPKSQSAARKVESHGWMGSETRGLSLDLLQQSQPFHSPAAAPVSWEMTKPSLFSSDEPLLSQSAISSDSGFTFGSQRARSTAPKFPGQEINLEGGHSAPLGGHSLFLSRQPFSLPPTGTGLFGSALGGLPNVCQPRFGSQMGPPVPLLRDEGPLSSERPFLLPQGSTSSPAPPLPSLVPIGFGAAMKKEGRPPAPVQDQHSSLPGLQLQSLLLPKGTFSFPSAPEASRPVAQFAGQSKISRSADYCLVLPENESPLSPPASSSAKKPPVISLRRPSAKPCEKSLLEKKPEETPQVLDWGRPLRSQFTCAKKKKKFAKEVCPMPPVQKPLSAVSWPQLFKLQNQDGYWQLTPELGTLLDLDVAHLVNVSLTKKGIQSLGPKGKEKLLQLIATLLVLQVIRFKQLEGITFKSLMKLNDSPPSQAFEAVKKAVDWAKRTHRQFPAICQRLELGKDWDSATKKLLHIKITGASSSLPPVNKMSAFLNTRPSPASMGFACGGKI